jgi:hypothetical protein
MKGDKVIDTASSLIEDDFVVATARKTLTDQQISIQADRPYFTAEGPNIFQVLLGRLAWAQRAHAIVFDIIV